MRLFIALSLVLFGSATLSAQYATSGMEQPNSAPPNGSQTFTVYNSATQKTTTVVVPMSQLSSCPVSLRAQQASAANSMMVAGGRPKGVAQFLHLTMANPAGSTVTKATVTVRGLLPKTRATLTPMTLGNDPSDAARTLDVTFSAAAGPAFNGRSADLWVPGLSAVSSVDLVSLTYADGSMWTPKAGKTCRTPIDGIMLVGAR